MDEVVDAKIVKAIFVESCGECPYAQYVRGLYSNYLECSKLNQVIHEPQIFLTNCPLDEAMCVITELTTRGGTTSVYER